MNAIWAEILHALLQMSLIYAAYVVGQVSYHKQMYDRLPGTPFNRRPAYVLFFLACLIVTFFQWVFR